MRLISSLFSLSLLTLVVAQDYQHVLHPGRRMPSLADLLTVDRRASLFYDYARDDSALVRSLARLAGLLALFAFAWQNAHPYVSHSNAYLPE